MLMVDNMELIHIFLADDDEDDRFLFKKAFKDSKLPVIVRMAYDGESLIRELSTIESPPPPDVIFLDINMPKIDGKEALIDIRKSEKFRNVPVIMFSTSTNKHDIDFARSHGANLYISKDFFFSNQKRIIPRLFTNNWKTYLQDISHEGFVLSKDFF